MKGNNNAYTAVPLGAQQDDQDNLSCNENNVSTASTNGTTIVLSTNKDCPELLDTCHKPSPRRSSCCMPARILFISLMLGITYKVLCCRVVRFHHHHEEQQDFEMFPCYYDAAAAAGGGGLMDVYYKYKVQYHNMREGGGGMRGSVRHWNQQGVEHDWYGKNDPDCRNDHGHEEKKSFNHRSHHHRHHRNNKYGNDMNDSHDKHGSRNENGSSKKHGYHQWGGHGGSRKHPSHGHHEQHDDASSNPHHLPRHGHSHSHDSFSSDSSDTTSDSINVLDVSSPGDFDLSFIPDEYYEEEKWGDNLQDDIALVPAVAIEQASITEEIPNYKTFTFQKEDQDVVQHESVSSSSFSSLEKDSHVDTNMGDIVKFDEESENLMREEEEQKETPL